MYQLILTVCLLASPQICHDEDVPSQMLESERACLETAQFAIARWTSENPNWSVSRCCCTTGEAL